MEFLDDSDITFEPETPFKELLAKSAYVDLKDRTPASHLIEAMALDIFHEVSAQRPIVQIPDELPVAERFKTLDPFLARILCWSAKGDGRAKLCQKLRAEEFIDVSMDTISFYVDQHSKVDTDGLYTIARSLLDAIKESYESHETLLKHTDLSKLLWTKFRKRTTASIWKDFFKNLFIQNSGHLKRSICEDIQYDDARFATLKAYVTQAETAY